MHAADSPLPMTGTAPSVAVIGAGAWGTTLAAILAKREPVVLVTHRPEVADEINRSHRNERRLPGIDLPDDLVASADPAAVRGATDLVIFAVPSSHLRSVAGAVGSVVEPSADVLSVVKGLETRSLLRMSEVIAEGTGIAPARIAALSGPNLATRSRGDLPASAVVAAEDLALAARIAGTARPPRVPSLRQPRHPRRRAVRRAQERDRDRGGSGGRPRLR